MSCRHAIAASDDRWDRIDPKQQNAPNHKTKEAREVASLRVDLSGIEPLTS